MKQARSILAILLFGCAVMAVVDGVIQPGYAIKSLVKLTLFLGLPLWWSRQAKVSLRPLFTRPRQGLRAALLLGAGVFAVILGGFFLTRGIFDFSGLTTALTVGTGVRRENFLWVALYISFVNSLPGVRLFDASSVSAPQVSSGAELSGLRPLPCGDDPRLVRSAGSAPHSGWAGLGWVDLLPSGRAFRQSLALLGGTPRRQPCHQCHRLPALCRLGGPLLL